MVNNVPPSSEESRVCSPTEKDPRKGWWGSIVGVLLMTGSIAEKDNVRWKALGRWTSDIEVGDVQTYLTMSCHSLWTNPSAGPKGTGRSSVHERQYSQTSEAKVQSYLG